VDRAVTGNESSLKSDVIAVEVVVPLAADSVAVSFSSVAGDVGAIVNGDGDDGGIVLAAVSCINVRHVRKNVPTARGCRVPRTCIVIRSQDESCSS